MSRDPSEIEIIVLNY